MERVEYILILVFASLPAVKDEEKDQRKHILYYLTVTVC
jgi:hypothetical protein